jgi:hypothetical protein
VVVFADRPERIWYSGASFDPRRGYNGRHRTDAPSGRRGTERICGAAVLVPRESLERVGAFDERLFAYVEDADWSLRAREMGLELVVEPRSRIRHKVSASTGGEGSDSALYYSTRNTLAVCERHAPLGRVGTWRRRAVVVLAHAGQALLARRPRRIGAVLEGWRDFRRGASGPRL